MIVEGPTVPAAKASVWVGDIPAVWADARPDRPAIVIPERGLVVSYDQLKAHADRFVEIALALGSRPGDRIAWLGRNSDLFFAALFGSIAGGFVLVPLNWRCAAPELAYMIEDSEARLVIVDPGFQAVLERALEGMAPSAGARPAVLPTEGEESLRARIEGWTARPAPAPRDADQVCLQIYTSGTTGRPKGVLITHGGLTFARQAELVSEDWADWDETDVILSPLPSFHVGGLSWMLIGLVRGLTCILTNDAGPARLIELIETHAVTRTFIVPTVVRSIVTLLKETGAVPPRIKTVTYGAAVMSEDLLRDAIEVLGCRFGQYYGMTECTGTVTFLPPRDHDLTRPRLLRSVGRPQAGMALEIRDPAGRGLPPGQPGEIWVRTPTVMKGYWRNEAATTAALVVGWYRTGDGGMIDEEGYLFLTDRIRDMIISGGENIYPAEVEAALRQHPGLLDVAVVGVPDEHWGERVAAIVERRPGAVDDAPGLIAFAAERLAKYKCPREVHFVDALPRTPLGKVQRGLARARVVAASPTRQPLTV